MSDFRAHIQADLDLGKAKSQMDAFLNQKKKIDIQVDTGATDAFKRQLEGIGKNIKVKPGVDTSEVKRAFNEFYQNQQRINSTKIKISGLDVTKDTKRIQELGNQLEILEKRGKELGANLKAPMSAAQIDKMVSSFDKASFKLGEMSAKSKEVKKSFTALDSATDANKTLSWLQNNTKAVKVYGESLKQLSEQQRKASSDEERKSLKSEVNKIKSEASSLGLTGKSFTSEFKGAFGKIFQFSQIYGGINQVISATGNAVSQLKEMDNILTEISKVSDMTSGQLKQLGANSFDYANKYGKTVTSYLEGVQEMNRSGFYGKRGIELADTSVLAQAAGDMTSDVANSYLLATNAAYEYEGSAKKLNAVLDGQNEITNRNSVNMTDMAEATTQAGSMAAQTGVSIEQLSALTGTAVARTKKGGNEIGTALKALFINLQNTQNKKIVGTFDDLGISMTKMSGDSELLKTPIELIAELSKVYNKLPDGSVDKANILTNIGGKHHANVLSSILSGQADYNKMIQDYSEGSGSAAVEAEKSANNWQGSLNKLSNSWTALVQNFANSDGITSGVKALTGLISGVDKATTKLSPIPAMLGLVGGIRSTQKGWGKQVYNAPSYKVA